MKRNLLLRIAVMLAIYLGLTYYGGEYGRILLYPVRMLVTFLHEFGHAFGALITGGRVTNLEIRPDGSGVCWTAGGIPSIILMGGYIGSAIFGNLLFYIGSRASNQVAKGTTYFLASVMVFVGLVWFTSLFTTGMLLVFALTLFLLARNTNFDSDVLLFFGLASILFIIQDFNVGPSSDLAKYAEIFVVIPANVWMYIWLAIVVLLFVYNIRLIFRESKTVK
ncbi:MAG: M50 family metallopeptidase [Bacteroidota bacterium]